MDWKYLGIKLIAGAIDGWVAVIDCGDGPVHWDKQNVAEAIANRGKYGLGIPEALFKASSDLNNKHADGVTFHND